MKRLGHDTNPQNPKNCLAVRVFLSFSVLTISFFAAQFLNSLHEWASPKEITFISFGILLVGFASFLCWWSMKTFGAVSSSNEKHFQKLKSKSVGELNSEELRMLIQYYCSRKMTDKADELSKVLLYRAQRGM